MSGLKNEIAKQLLDLNASTFSMKPVKVCSLKHLMSQRVHNCFVGYFCVPSICCLFYYSDFLLIYVLWERLAEEVCI